MSYKLKVKLRDFCAAHRLLPPYEGKCNHLHGHNYGVEITLFADYLDERGMVADFSELKKVANAWVDEHLDHSTLVFEKDFALLDFVKMHQQKHKILAYNSTVECLAETIFKGLNELFSLLRHEMVKLTHVEVWETPQTGVVYTCES